MNKVLVTLSGVYVLILGLIMAGLVVISVVGAGSAPAESKPPIPGIVFLGVLAAGILATAVRIFKRKNWSRITLIILSSFAIFPGVIQLFTLANLPKLIESQKPGQQVPAGAVNMLIVLDCIFFILIPVLFLILLNRPSVKEMFCSAVGEKGNTDGNTDAVPLGFKLISILYFVSPVGIFFYLSNPQTKGMPMVIGDFVFNGPLTLTWSLVMTALSVYTAWGLWKLRRSAWTILVAMNAFTLFTGTLTFLLMKEETYSRLIQGGVSVPMPDFASFKILSLSALLFPIVVLFYAFWKRGLFLNLPEAEK